jgi:hypothetical protein
MWLQVPNEVKHALWEGSLELATDEAADTIERGLPDDSQSEAFHPYKPRELPVVSIGLPEVWPLASLYRSKPMSPFLQASLKDADFYFVRLVCSFRPNTSTLIDWARFSIALLPDTSGRQPLAFDLHPSMVYQKIQHHVKVVLNPTLKFQEIEGGLGEIEFGLEYPELQPIITASGIGEAVPSWDYETARGLRVQGSKFMHLLLKAPKGMVSGEAVLDLVANVGTRGFRLPILGSRAKPEPHLSVRLWG